MAFITSRKIPKFLSDLPTHLKALRAPACLAGWLGARGSGSARGVFRSWGEGPTWVWLVQEGLFACWMGWGKVKAGYELV